MKAIFFPYTHINNTVAEALNSWFRQIIVYHPSKLNDPAIMNDAESIDLISIRTPVSGDEDLIKRIIQDFKAWGDIHNSGEMDTIKFTGNTIPFFDENSINQIKADIKQGMSNPAEMKEDHLLNARVFLHLAQEFDQQNNEMRQELLLCEELEQKLINDLMGTDKNSADHNKPKEFSPDSSGNFMIEQRIAAWSRLFMHEQECVPLFITTSRQAIEYLTDKAGAAGEILTINAYEPEADGFLDKIDDMARNVWDPSTTIPHMKTRSLQDTDNPEIETSNRLTFYIIPDKTPHEFFAGCADIDISGIDLVEERKKVRNTILGLFQRSQNRS
ncbi:hypothetical protein BuS5_03168 [Desulfosarcina sp. BuS5]|uniref:hypothetical protein n=1 Tax=Desulfosarcina sp. BuS5 TaxID=933262 RepID=UPI000489D07B|nr:hypothetical protein [Desulfosarcina sp. BuS5]WDN90198.1 hypothetical protein BuS5_03168 [Desulfosarcina sp. BuS5]